MCGRVTDRSEQKGFAETSNRNQTPIDVVRAQLVLPVRGVRLIRTMAACRSIWSLSYAMEERRGEEGDMNRISRLGFAEVGGGEEESQTPWTRRRER